MNMRFSTEAANADFLGEDAPDAADGLSEDVGADGTPRDPTGRPQARTPLRREREGEAKPGKDINAEGFVQDNDAGKP